MFLNRLNRSFSTRLSLAILSFTVLVFIATFSVSYHFSARTIEQDARDDSENLLEVINLKVTSLLRRVEVVPNNLRWVITNRDLTPEDLYGVTRRVLENNPDICGCAIAFEPNHFQEKGRYFSPYSYRDGDKIRSHQLGSEDYDYFTWEWYEQPKRLDKPCWSEPYFDEGGGEMLMCTYSAPIYDKQGKFIGIFTSDISLEWLTDLINGMKKSDLSYTYMLGQDGTYIVHYLRERILNNTIFDVASQMTDTTVMTLGHRMIAGESGMEVFDNDGVESYAFFAPIENTSWSIGIVLPSDEIFGELYRINKIVFIIAITGLLLLFVLCLSIVSRLTRPLHKFAVSARQIARGNFHAKLPKITSQDEMKELADSFQYMQNELTNYIENLKNTTAAKERMDSELRIARDIQMGMVPTKFPPFPDRKEIDVYAMLRPAKEVGGDLYDYFMEGDNIFFAIGDVAGKGVPASLFMSVTRNLFRATAGHFQNPSEIVSSINNTISETNEANMFVTLLVAVLNLKTGVMKFCNAGHNPPILITPEGKSSYMSMAPNIPVGVMDKFEYKDQEITLSDGTMLLCYTDGVTEAENATQELYGENRLLQTINDSKGLNAQQVVKTVVEHVAKHVQDTPASDDITLLTIGYNKLNSITDMMPQTLTITNNVEEITRMAEFIDAMSEQLQLSPALTMNLQLALEEAVSNVILYAYKEADKTIDITFAKAGNQLEVTITDCGVAFDPTAKEDPDHLNLSVEERPIGGLGIFLIKKLMDSVTYKRENEKNILTIKKTV